MPADERQEAALLLWGVMHGLWHEARRRMEPVLREHGLGSPVQLAILAALRGRGPQRLVDVGRRMPFPVSTLSESADRLVAEGFATRRTNPDDRRSVLFELTPRGQTVLGQVCARGAGRIEGLLGGLDQAQVQALVVALRVLSAQLDAGDSADGLWCALPGDRVEASEG